MQPAKELLSAVRVGEVASAQTDRAVRSPPVLVLVRAPAADDAASGEWKLRGEHQTRFRVRRMGTGHERQTGTAHQHNDQDRLG